MLTSIRTTKEKLLRAALVLVARDGFQAATMAAIADLAGVAEATLYRHFPSTASPARSTNRSTPWPRR